MPAPSEGTQHIFAFESLSPDDVAYREAVVDARRFAEMLDQSFREHMARTYKLTALDRFEENGVIMRAEPEPRGVP